MKNGLKWLIPAVLLVGCQSAAPVAEKEEFQAPTEESALVEEAADETRAAFPRSQLECSEESAGVLRSWMEASAQNQGAVIGAHLSSFEFGQPEPHATLFISEEALYLNDELLEFSPDAIERALAAAQREYLEVGAEGPFVAVQLGEVISAERMTSLASVLAAFSESYLYAVTDVPKEAKLYEPPTEELQLKASQLLDHHSPHDAVVAMVDAAEEAMQDCEPMMEAFAATAHIDEARERSAFLEEQLPASWLACDCEVDVSWVLTLLHWSHPMDSNYGAAGRVSFEQVQRWLDEGEWDVHLQLVRF